MFLQTSVCLNCFYVYPRLLINTTFYFYIYIYIYEKVFLPFFRSVVSPGSVWPGGKLPLTKSVKDDLL